MELRMNSFGSHDSLGMGGQSRPDKGTDDISQYI